MVPPSQPSGERESRLQVALVACLEALETEACPDARRLAGQYPEFTEELAEFLAARARVDLVAAPLRHALRTAVTVRPALTAGRSALPRPPTPPAFLDDHEVLEEIASGGMGVVYRARQKSLGRLVALKMLRPDYASSPAEIQRFRNEAQTVAELDHPHIVPIHEVGQQNGQLYFTMKLIAGESLDRRLQTFASDLQAASRLLVTIARAIHHAHQRGILHRDLKPSNILLDAEGQPHVTDFGLAKRLVGDSNLTQTGQIVGTPSYMAPEQTDGKRAAITTATDVYGLGAVFYALLTGQPPFRGATPLDTLIQVKEQDPEPPRRLNAQVPRDLETICLKALAKEPGNRYASALALAEDVECWLKGEPIQARPVGRLERWRRWGARNPLLAALSLALIMLVLIGIGGLVTALWIIAGKSEAVQDQFKLALEREKSLRRLLYAADIRMAHEAWDQGDVGRVRLLLARHEPEDGKEDLRTFLWFYLKRLSHWPAPQILKGHQGDAYCVVYRPDGKEFATAGKDGTVRLWDAITGKPRQVLHVADQEVNAVVYAPEGSALVTAEDDGLIKLWECATGKEVRVVTRHGGEAGGVAFSPDGKLLATGGEDIIELFPWPAGRRSQPLPIKKVRLEDMAFSPDGKLLAAAMSSRVSREAGNAFQGKMVVWNLEGPLPPTVKFEAVYPQAAHALAFTPDGHMLAVTVGPFLDLYEVADGQHLARWMGHQGNNQDLQTVAISPDGLLVASGGNDGRVILRDTATGRIVGLPAVPRERIWGLAFSRDGKMLTATTSAGKVLRWQRDAKHPGKARYVWSRPGADWLLSPDASRVISWKPGEAADLWDGARGLTVARLSGCGSARPQFSSDGSRIGVLGSDQRFRVWETQTGRPLREVPLPVSPTRPDMVAAFSEKMIALRSERPLGFQCWDFDMHELGFSFDRNEQHVQFSHDGKRAAVAQGDGIIELLDCDRRITTQRLVGPSEPVSVLAFSRSSEVLAVGTSQGGLALWDTGTGRMHAQLSGHSGGVQLAAFSPDGLTLATASGSEIKLWDQRTGLELLQLTRPAKYIMSLAFTEDGNAFRALAQDTSGAELLEWTATHAAAAD
jgi:WD40 repeat protein